MVTVPPTRAPRTPPLGTSGRIVALTYDAAMSLSVALVQLDARDEVEANIAAAVALADDAARGGARFVLLPEYLQYRGSDEGFRVSARPIPGPHTEPFSEVARRHGAWILVGSTAETSADPARPYNTSALIAPDGSVAAVYRRVHLFDVAVDAGPVDTKSARVTAGDRLVTAEVDGAIVGLSICYDLRFPELYRALALAGAQVLTVPSAFTARPAATIGRCSFARARSRMRPTSSPRRRSADHPARPLTGVRSSSIRGHGRRPGTRRRRDRPRRTRPRAGRVAPASDPGPGKRAARCAPGPSIECRAAERTNGHEQLRGSGSGRCRTRRVDPKLPIAGRPWTLLIDVRATGIGECPGRLVGCRSS